MRWLALCCASLLNQTLKHRVHGCEVLRSYEDLLGFRGKAGHCHHGCTVRTMQQALLWVLCSERVQLDLSVTLAAVLARSSELCGCWTEGSVPILSIDVQHHCFVKGLLQLLCWGHAVVLRCFGCCLSECAPHTYCPHVPPMYHHCSPSVALSSSSISFRGTPVPALA